MADNSGNLFRNSLKELIEENEDIIKKKFRVFAEPSMMPDRPSSARLARPAPARPISARPISARPISARPDNISLTELIAMLIPRAVDRPASRAVDKPTALEVARPASRPASRASSRQTSATAARQTAATKISLSHLNPDIMGLVRNQLSIAENSKYTLEEYKFVEGIPEEEIVKYTYNLLQNRNALYYLTEKAKIVDKKVVYYWLSSNTNPVAIELIKKALKENNNIRINWGELCKNHEAADILLNDDYRGSLDWDTMSINTNPKVIKFLDSARNYKKINWDMMSENESPAAISLLQWQIIKNPLAISSNHISRNAGAIDILKKYINKVTGDGLSANKANGAYNLLLKILEGNPKDINWAALSANPSKWAFDFLQKEENKKNIRWDMMSNNTSKSAIQLLEKRIKQENEFSDEYYKALPKHQKIDWLEVSRNPSAIELIKERIKYEAVLKQDKLAYYRELNPNERINYKELATNPSIFVKVGRARPVAPVRVVAAARPSSARPEPKSSQVSLAARVERAAAANTAKFIADLEQLRAYRIAQKQDLTSLASLATTAAQVSQRPTALQAALPAPRVSRTAARTPRVAALSSRASDARASGRPPQETKARAYKPPSS